MKFDLFVAALRARFGLFLLVVVVTVASAATVSLLLPKTYIATASLLVDARDEQSLHSGRSQMAERERLGYLQTQVDILGGAKVARLAARKLDLASQAKSQADFLSETGGSGEIDDWLGQRLIKQVKIETTQSSVMRLSFAAADREFAARAANALAEAYLETMLALRTEPSLQASLWFENQVASLRQNLQVAQNRLAAFQQEKGIVISDERYEMESSRLIDLANQAARSRGRSEDAVGGNLQRAESRLRELSVELGQRHPQYQQQKALVDSLREKLISAPRSSESTGGNQSLLAVLQAQRDRLLKLKSVRGELAMLTHDVEIAERTYDAAMQRLMSMRLESKASQSSVSLLDPAIAPGKPARPRIGLNVALALLAGIGLGLCLVYLLEFFDQRIRRINDLANDPDVPLLAVISRWQPVVAALPAPVHPFRLPDIK